MVHALKDDDCGLRDLLEKKVTTDRQTPSIGLSLLRQQNRKGKENWTTTGALPYLFFWTHCTSIRGQGRFRGTHVGKIPKCYAFKKIYQKMLCISENISKMLCIPTFCSFILISVCLNNEQKKLISVQPESNSNNAPIYIRPGAHQLADYFNTICNTAAHLIPSNLSPAQHNPLLRNGNTQTPSSPWPDRHNPLLPNGCSGNIVIFKNTLRSYSTQYPWVFF